VMHTFPVHCNATRVAASTWNFCGLISRKTKGTASIWSLWFQPTIEDRKNGRKTYAQMMEVLSIDAQSPLVAPLHPWMWTVPLEDFHTKYAQLPDADYLVPNEVCDSFTIDSLHFLFLSFPSPQPIHSYSSWSPSTSSPSLMPSYNRGNVQNGI
jgi:hypothetical protein